MADAARATPQPMLKADPPDWFAFRRRHPDLGIAKTGEDGSMSDWQALLREVGADKLTSALLTVRGNTRKGERIWLARVLEALAVNSSPSDGAKGANDGAAAKRARIDALIWCLCHSPKCYADAIQPWTPIEAESKSIRTPFGRVERVPMADPLTPERRAKVEARAAATRLELLTQCGMPDERRYNGALYETVRATPRLVAWLQSQRLLPA